MTAVGSSSPVACPRCGYDLSGTPASWTSHCPLQGQCTECGLELEWSRVFVLSEHDWLFEYHWRRGPLRRLILTILHALRPRRFWTQVRMTDPIHAGPLVTLAALGALLVLVAQVGLVVYVRYLFLGTPLSSAPPGMQGSMQYLEYWFQETLSSIPLLPRFLLFGAGMLAALLIMPWLYLLLPVTLRQAKVRPAHLARIWVYSLVGPVILAVAWPAAWIILRHIDWPAGATALNPWGWIRWTNVRGSITLQMARHLLPGILLLALLLAWTVPWWCMACRHYLRLCHPLAVALLLGTVALCLGLVIEAMLYGSRWF
jgi:hypothetical protein